MSDADPGPPDSGDDLLESVHTFPGPYQIKVIGQATEAFVARVLEAAGEHLAGPGDLEHRVRMTPGGRHMAVTLDLQLQSAAQVRAIYADLREIEGLAMLL